MELPNTKIRSVLPSTAQQGSPNAIIDAWGGGVADIVRNRLLVWGGGHSDYYGNEMYALDLTTLTMQRIIDPSPYTAQSSCSSALPDGTPTSRHTYGGLAYVTHKDQMFSVWGSKAPCGYADSATWMYDFPTSKWKVAVAQSPQGGPGGALAVYDSSTRRVYFKDVQDFYAFSPDTNTYTKLNSASQNVDYHLSAAIDTKRRKFVMIGNGIQVVDLNTFTMTSLSTTNTPGFVTSMQSPGVAYDPVADRIVAWHGGSAVYALDMDSKVWTRVDTNAGPTSAAPWQGTFGRWAYIPQYRVFAMVNSIDENAWVFRLAP